MSDEQKPKLTVVTPEGEIEFDTETQMDEFTKLMDEWQEGMLKEQLELAQRFEVSQETAAAIQYLRTRSRYTPEKEMLLITRDHEKCPIPLGDVLSGQF